jgi:hypothetical protein
MKNATKMMYIPAEFWTQRGIILRVQKRGRKSHRFQIMFQGGLKTGQMGETCLDVMFLSQKSFGHRSAGGSNILVHEGQGGTSGGRA